MRRGLWLNYATIAYNSLEAVVSLVAGIVAGSVVLVGFGIDSVIEVTASGAAQWRLRADLDHARRERVERMTLRVDRLVVRRARRVRCRSTANVAVVRERARALGGWDWNPRALGRDHARARARQTTRVARASGSAALEADAMQTSLCAYLSVIALAGVALNTLFGWWWCDPAAALAMVPIIAKEGVQGIRGEARCEDCC